MAFISNNSNMIYNNSFDDNSSLDANYSLGVVLNTGYEALQIQIARLRIGILVSYLVTMALGLFGNGLVIFIIGRYPTIRNKSVANYYIWNLAFADLMFILTMPFFCYATYYNNWPFGEVVCKIAAAFKETMRYTSMFTLVALSFDRYLASFYNQAHLRTIRVGVAVCCIIWLMSGTIAVPYAMYAQVQQNQCGVRLPSDNMMEFMTYFQLASALIVPLLLICVSYALLALRLRAILGNRATRSVQRPNRKMTRTVLVVIITFIIWQTPYHANNIINVHKRISMSHSGIAPTVNEMLTSMYLNTISTILVFISSCCNPIIYGILNDNYRSLYSAVLCVCCQNSILGLRRTTSTLSKRGSNSRQHNWRIPSFVRNSSSNSNGGKSRALSMTASTLNTEQIPLEQSVEDEDQEAML